VKDGLLQPAQPHGEDSLRPKEQQLRTESSCTGGLDWLVDEVVLRDQLL